MARCCRCRSWLVATIVAALAIAREAGLRAVLHPDDGFINSLQPIRRVRLSDLDLDDFRQNHVLRAVPLIVELASPTESLWDRRAVLTACANNSVTLLSRATRRFLIMLGPDYRNISRSEMSWKVLMLDLMISVFSDEGGGLKTFVRTRDKLSLAELVDRVDRADAAAPSSWWR